MVEDWRLGLEISRGVVGKVLKGLPEIEIYDTSSSYIIIVGLIVRLLESCTSLSVHKFALESNYSKTVTWGSVDFFARSHMNNAKFAVEGPYSIFSMSWYAPKIRDPHVSTKQVTL